MTLGDKELTGLCLLEIFMDLIFKYFFKSVETWIENIGEAIN